MQLLRIEAETCLCHALDIARRQQAKSLELRAAMSLARLWQQQGKRAAARELLAPVYSWFTGDCSEDTGSLQPARASCKVLRVWWRPSPWASRHMSSAKRARICACVRTR